MNSKLLKKKSALIFLSVFAIIIVGCVFLNAFLVKPAVAKSGNNVDSSATDEVTEDEPEIERKKTDDGFIYYILTDDNKNVYVTINSYDGDEKNVIKKAIGNTHTAARAIRQSYIKRQMETNVADTTEPANAGT